MSFHGNQKTTHKAMNLPVEAYETSTVWLLLPFLVVAMGTDLVKRRIPNLLIVTMLGSAVALNVTLGGAGALGWSAGGAAVGFLILLPMYVLGGLGAGDVKLLSAAGAFLGPWATLLAGIAALLGGGVLALAIVLRHRMSRTSTARRSSPVESPLPGTAAAKDIELPYSLAIAAGAGFAAYQLGMASPVVVAGVSPW
jgi:prepilin peptidase CpaA